MNSQPNPAQTQHGIILVQAFSLFEDAFLYSDLFQQIINLGKVWSLIEKHIALERKTVALAKESLEATEDRKGLLVQRYLLEYLLADEQKHDVLLEKMDAVKKGMYPYG